MLINMNVDNVTSTLSPVKFKREISSSNLDYDHELNLDKKNVFNENLHNIMSQILNQKYFFRL